MRCCIHRSWYIFAHNSRVNSISIAIKRILPAFHVSIDTSVISQYSTLNGRPRPNPSPSAKLTQHQEVLEKRRRKSNAKRIKILHHMMCLCNRFNVKVNLFINMILFSILLVGNEKENKKKRLPFSKYSQIRFQ